MPRPNWADDPSIPDQARLWRGIVPRYIKTLPDGRQVPHHGAFVTQEMSVNIAEDTTLDEMLEKGSSQGIGWRVWEFTAKVVRDVGCIADRDPVDGDPSHTIVVRADLPGKRITESQAKKLVSQGRWADEAAAEEIPVTATPAPEQ